MKNKMYIFIFIILALTLSSNRGYTFWFTFHKDITVEALSDTFSTETLDLVVKYNQSTDTEEYELNEAHWDNETFEQAGLRLQNLLQEAVTNAAQKNKDTALKAFGRATHTLQDFYSHTSWVTRNCMEKVVEIHPDIYHIPNPSPDFKCDLTLGPQGDRFAITSDFYPDEITPEGKCSHSEINKDCPYEHARDLSCPRGVVECNGKILFEHAFDLAVEHTRVFYGEFVDLVKAQYPEESDEIIAFFTGKRTICSMVNSKFNNISWLLILLPSLSLLIRKNR